MLKQINIAVIFKLIEIHANLIRVTNHHLIVIKWVVNSVFVNGG